MAHFFALIASFLWWLFLVITIFLVILLLHELLEVSQDQGYFFIGGNFITWIFLLWLEGLGTWFNLITWANIECNILVDLVTKWLGYISLNQLLMENFTKKLIGCLDLEFWIYSNHCCKNRVPWFESSKKLLCHFMIIPLYASKRSNIQHKDYWSIIHLSHGFFIMHDKVLQLSLQQVHLVFSNIIGPSWGSLNVS
jgi:hypothetical protein